MWKTRNTPESFWSRVDRSGGEDSCWPWTGGLGRGGYGKVKYQDRTWSAHRLAWTLANGPIPDGLQINHSCDNRPCCNPRHLNPGTQKDNIAEAVSRGRMASGDRQGLRVHPERSPKGERNGSARLTAAQVLQIRASDLRHHALAERYGVSVVTIGAIRRGRIWKHLLNQEN